MTTVAHIVPLFAPVVCGVGDYALNLGRALRSSFGIESRFIVCNAEWRGPSEVDGFNVVGVDPVALSKHLEANTSVLLHYVGYGYHPKGVPRALLRAIEERRYWRVSTAPGRPRSEHLDFQLVTIFHEIWSSGPPWKSAFFFKPIQRKIVKRLLALSSHSFANTREALKLLQRAKTGPVTFLPISANIQPIRDLTPHPRGSELYQPLIFGQPWTRLATIKKHSDLLRTLHSQRLLQRVFVMGHGAEDGSEDVAALRSVLPKEKIFIVGEKSSGQAAEIFDEADFLLSPSRASDLCKSSAAMSAFACGCPVVISDLSGSASPEPLGPEHFVVVRDAECELRNVAAFALRKWNLQCVAIQARAWFLESATWAKLAEQVAAKLLDPRAIPALRK